MPHGNNESDYGKSLHVLDSSVLMHDPMSLFHFHEHNLFIPMRALEDLDRKKKGDSDVARNARHAHRILDELLRKHGGQELSLGIALADVAPGGYLSEKCTGRLFLQHRKLNGVTVKDDVPFDPNMTDENGILMDVLSLQNSVAGKTEVVLVSKEINRRIKATAIGIRAEDYRSDQTLDDIDLLYSGYSGLTADFWSSHTLEHVKPRDCPEGTYEIRGPSVRDWFPQQFLFFTDDSDSADGGEYVVRQVNGDCALVELVKNYRTSNHAVWGIQARNQGQNFALNALLDPEIDFVTLLGAAGTGKTLLALAAGLVMTLDQKLYREIIMTRETIPLGEDIGFLPGTEEEKMTPWMGALLDNLELLGDNRDTGTWERAATNTLLLNRVKVRSLNFMRGRTFLGRYVILDEAQNLTAKQMKTLITRAGPGTKIVCLGNIGQVDTPYLTPVTSGLTYAVERFRGWGHAAHVALRRGERSRLADYANENL